MIRTIFAFILLLCAYSSINAQEKSLVDKAKVGIRNGNAEVEIADRNYHSAIAMLRDVLRDYPNDQKACYLLAGCFYELKNYWLAKSYIDSSFIAGPATAPEHLLTTAKVYHSIGQLDDAEDFYKKFRNTRKEGYLYEGELEKFLREIQTAREQMVKPKNVKVKPINNVLNSQYDDYAPSVSADGNTMFFTTRRPYGLSGGEIDSKGDHKFFEDIYESHRENGSWSRATRAGEPINTDKYDAVLSLAPDGQEMYVYINDGKNGGDIYLSRKDKSGEQWSKPEVLPSPINTSFYEGSISVTADGNTMYFISERRNGFGFGDIWRVTKLNGVTWGLPENLGPVINTSFDEKFVFVHPDGKTLFFASNGHSGLGSYDIYRTSLVGDQFTTPVNLGYPINTVNEESTFSLTADYKTMYLAAVRKEGMGERDIYELDLSNYSILEVPNSDNTKGLVSGSIVTETAKRIPEAFIQISEDGSATPLASLTSDASGNYEAKLPLGKTYLIKVSAPGFNSTVEKVLIKPSPDGRSITVKHVVLKSGGKAEKKVKVENDADGEDEEQDAEEEE
ncbi:MAG: hypothetical protein V4616_08580 [Bacteroidota bacterium]